MEDKQVFLVCNAHIDIAWVWDWEEGVAEALSTFRVAADFCEQFDSFVFNHNEAFLYEYIKELDPALFLRIKKLVKKGNWKIVGGWYIQPDCVLPSGESFIRQILRGKAFFQREFGEDVVVAANFDSFGHARGLCQILANSGYAYYLICRPFQKYLQLESDDFIWKGFDGSEIIVHRASEFYQSFRGEARAKAEKFIAENSGLTNQMILWGIGDHGGGPSKIDIEDLAELMEKSPISIKHSYPLEYFQAIDTQRASMPIVARPLTNFAVGCYSSQIVLKQRHRGLENALYRAEKMRTQCELLGLLPYPKKEFEEIEKALLISEFHDMLPGSGIKKVESSTIEMLDFGLYSCRKIVLSAMIALSDHYLDKVGDGHVGVVAYNPHPFPLTDTFACEFNLPDLNPDSRSIIIPEVSFGGEPIPSQVEEEEGNLPSDWRKKISFRATLSPMSVNLFDCTVSGKGEKTLGELEESDSHYYFAGSDLRVGINKKTGFIDGLECAGNQYLSGDSFIPKVFNDNPDPWGMIDYSFQDVVGQFRLMNNKELEELCQFRNRNFGPVHVVENGPVRTIFEVHMVCNKSTIMLQYVFPKEGTEWSIRIRVMWSEHERMLKLVVPTGFKNARLHAAVPFGIEEYKTDGKEQPCKNWVMISGEDGYALSAINNGTSAVSGNANELHLTLLRSPIYASHPVDNVRINVPDDHYFVRMDQGERFFTFWFNQGKLEDRLDNLACEANMHNESVICLSYFPKGTKCEENTGMFVLDNNAVQMVALKKAESGEGYIARLRETRGRSTATILSSPVLGLKEVLEFNPYEIKTILFDGKGIVRNVDLMER